MLVVVLYSNHYLNFPILMIFIFDVKVPEKHISLRLKFTIAINQGSIFFEKARLMREAV